MLELVKDWLWIIASVAGVGVSVGSICAVGIRLTWQASRLYTAVESGTQAINELHRDMDSLRSDIKQEVRTLHERADRHEQRIDKHGVLIEHLNTVKESRDYGAEQ